MRPYHDHPEVEVPVRWYRCAPSARPLGFVTAFGDAWFDGQRRFVPKVGMTREFDPSFVGNPRGFLGVRPCGGAEAWRSGVSLDNPPDPCNCVREAVVPIQEVPAGLVDGVNRTFTTSQVPVSAESLLLFMNGVQQIQGTNYSISADTIFMTPSSAPPVGSVLVVYYWVLN